MRGWRLILGAALVSLILLKPAAGNEIGGLNIGMSLAEVRANLQKKKLKVDKVNDAQSGHHDWSSFVIQSDRLSVSFCKNTVASITKSWDSSIHEFTYLSEDMNKKWGIPNVSVTQHYQSGKPSSYILLRWREITQIRRSLSLSQIGNSAVSLSISVFDEGHLCS